MKKNLLLMMMCVPVILAAQNGVTVSNLAVNAGTVTFNVSWDKATMPVELWSDTVWVFVDYNNKGVMERLPLLSGATLTETSAEGVGEVIEVSGNDKGVWVAGNARTESSFSATVQLLTAVKDVGGACVYGSNYPPVGKYISVPDIAFTGTPEYDITIKKDVDGTTELRKSGSPFTVPASYTVESFTDKTGAPGIILGGPQAQGSCTYTEPALVGTFANFNPENVGAATYVSLVDERDNKFYPVLKMGGRWMMARNLNYQKGLYHNTAAYQANGAPFTSVDNGVPAIGSYWCPGSGETSTKEACEVYGALYTWETAMMLDGTGTWTEDGVKYTSVASAGTYNHGRTAHNGAGAGGRGICPPNWHVPTDAEWGLFFDAVEGTGSVHSDAPGNMFIGVNAGTKSKAACLGDATDAAPLWLPTGCCAGTDVYGYRALPTGARMSDLAYPEAYGTRTWVWSSSATNAQTAWCKAIRWDFPGVVHWSYPRATGHTVRCIRDL